MKKAKYILCIILTAVFIFSTAAPAAALDADKFEARQVTAYLFSMEKTATLLCYFDPALPEVPYIDVLDYFSLTHSINYEFSSNDDGIYSLKSRNGETTELPYIMSRFLRQAPRIPASAPIITGNS